MEEENEHELEETLYAMLHYVDETQVDVKANAKDDLSRIVENAPQSTVRRYWRTSGDQNQPINTPFQKVNTHTPNENATINKNSTVTDKPKGKEEKRDAPVSESVDLSILQSPIPPNVKTVVILENEVESNVVELESSDEDEVVEVALPPKPTITIESSDEDEPRNEIQKSKSTLETKNEIMKDIKTSKKPDREVSTSPVPSVVSSVSDEFIRGDCIALNISSRHPDNHSFDFSLHGSDLLDQNTPSKRKRKKKSKDRATSTPVAGDAAANMSTTNIANECFATPKSKAKNKKPKSYLTTRPIPNPDVYDSDSNLSVIETNKSKDTYIVTDNSLPSVDVYESDSNQSETIKDTKSVQSKPNSNDIESFGSSFSLDQPIETPKSKKNNTVDKLNERTNSIVDLTDDYITLDSTGVEESIVVANVTGFTESEDYGDNPTITNKETPKFGSTKVPAILYEDLDFDNLKGKDKVCKRRRYSLTTLRAEMEKFYNESWGGEDFNHHEIQKNMSRDKSLWAIDPKDRMPAQSKRKISCNYCNRVGHRDDTCRMKPPVCYMCGSTGHYEPRCPRKICVNCGSPNYMYSTMCRKCASWGRITCAECGQNGHPLSHCPDLWRRYHNTIDDNTPLEENYATKKYNQLFCSGCTRRGHLVNTCRVTLPFSGLPINSPYVSLYRPVYFPSPKQDNTPNIQHPNQRNKQFQDSTVTSASTPHRIDSNKRQSKSPTVHESHVNKQRKVTIIDVNKDNQNNKNNVEKKAPQSNESNEESDKITQEPVKNSVETSVIVNADEDKAPDFIPITSTNHDKKGQIIQDNEVSDTSDVVTSARIYVTNEVIDKLKSKEGDEWLNEKMKKYDITVEKTDVNSFLSVKGKVADQEAFQTELREWTNISKKEVANADNGVIMTQEINTDQSSLINNIPKNRNVVLQYLNKAFKSLKEDFGDPNAIYKELMYLQNLQTLLLNKETICPKKVSNNRDHINKTLKKLNIVLLGQAGLDDGFAHLQELYSIQKRIMALKDKYIPIDVRREIGQHYHRIFTAVPRNDYVELLKKYYGSRLSPSMFKKKDVSFKYNSKIQKNDFIPPQQKNFANDTKVDGNVEGNMLMETKGQPRIKKTMNKLVFYHRRILRARPIDTVLRKTRNELVSKLDSHISILGTKAYISWKDLKKIRKIQEQAQVFLTNV